MKGDDEDSGDDAAAERIAQPIFATKIPPKIFAPFALSCGNCLGWELRGSRFLVAWLQA